MKRAAQQQGQWRLRAQPGPVAAGTDRLTEESVQSLLNVIEVRRIEEAIAAGDAAQARAAGAQHMEHAAERGRLAGGEGPGES
jgi:DNA-binding GntR family transcriptional regulator